MFSTLLIDEDRRHSSTHSRKSLSEDYKEKKEGCTFAKVKSCIKLFCAHLFSHVGLSALVVGYSIIGAFVFSHLEGENEIAIRVKVGNNRRETLDQLYNITEILRFKAVRQAVRIEELEKEIELLRDSKRKCERNRKREGKFLESVINQCKGDNVPLTDTRCSEFCKKNKVKLPVCKALCETRAPPCTYWHEDTYKDPLVSFEVVTNRTRRTSDELLDAHWMNRLREYREIREIAEEDIPNASNISDYWDLGASDQQEYKVIKPPATSKCSNIACVNHEDLRDIACLDLGQVDLLPGSLIGNARVKPLQKHFNVLWKSNWTREAEKVLKTFEMDVIMKVKTEGYDGKEANADDDVADEPSQWSISGALLYSVTIITTIGYGNIAPKTAWGQIATMVYATFGMPIFMLWASNMGTLMAQTFTFLYANVCCFMCRRAKKKKALKAMKRQEDRERETRSGSERESSKLLWSERDVSPALTTSTKLDGMTPYMQKEINGQDNLIQNSLNPYSAASTLKMDPKVKEMLSACATYNLDQGDDDDPLSEAVVEELRHADAMNIINERSLNVSPITSPQRTPQPFRVDRGEREGSAYENNADTPDRETSARPKTLERKSKIPHPSVVAINKKDGMANTSLLLTPPAQHSNRVSPIMAPKASREPSPTSSKIYLPTSEKDEDSYTKVIAKTKVIEADVGPPPIERVPPLPVLCFLGFYLTLGAVIFSAWENWTFLEGFYFSFITLTTIGFGDYVPGDSVMNVESKDGQYKLLCSVVYVLLGLAVLSMSFNLIQEEVVDFAIQLAKDCGVIDDDDEEDGLDGS